jgi:hypothetical protein
VTSWTGYGVDEVGRTVVSMAESSGRPGRQSICRDDSDGIVRDDAGGDISIDYVDISGGRMYRLPTRTE